MDAEQMFEALRESAAAVGEQVTIHTNPDTDHDRPAWYGLVCVHPLSDDEVGYSADTLTEALQRAIDGEVEAIRRSLAAQGIDMDTMLETEDN